MPSPYLVWGLLVYAWVANYLIRMGLSPLLPPIMTELGLSYTRAGFLATAFFYAYVAMQVPAGFLGDRLGRRRVVLGGILLGVLASLLTGLAGSFETLFLARLLTGLGQGCVFSNDRVIIAAYTPREKMARRLGNGSVSIVTEGFPRLYPPRGHTEGSRRRGFPPVPGPRLSTAIQSCGARRSRQHARGRW